ncbi:sulfite exporter TauE/SafE family protein [Janibacter melonis]|uniref:sulfite exporter TauE/SafE family protein n=1 Tax=Janibacter melonis TaxID=262209 RepID=UPI001E5C7E94|nr:sulfite exporter TauE/SafE family protein [Janibacter melonis]MCB5991971.1 sulfite exporter TauE/SafE family protein [Janibacter melonis]
MSPGELLVVGVAVALAAMLQGSIGFGMGMIAAPVVALVQPTLLPATLVLLAAVVTTLTLVTDRQHVDLRGTGWALTGRVPGSVAGAAVVALAPDRVLALLVAAVVLAGTVITGLGWRPEPTKGALLTAGAASGLFGTATSIGGPPMALVWQGHHGARLRGTMSAFFLVGSAVSVATLAVAGAVDAEIMRAVLLLLPMPVLGFVLSRGLNRVLDPVRQRRVAIAVSVVGAVLLIGQQVL